MDDVIDVPGAAKVHPIGIDSAGQVAGFYFDASGQAHGFLATPMMQPSLTADGTHTGNFTPGQPGLATASTSGPISIRASSSSAGPCDVTGNGVINVADVQLIVNEALGKAPEVNDLNADGVVNVADVQVVINAALLLGCTPVPPARTAAVAHLAVQSGNGQAACICFTSTLQAFQPIFVRATDVSGNPVAGATVTWSLASGQMTLASPASITDAAGVAAENISLVILNNFSSTAVPYLVATIQATSHNSSVTFTETQSLITTGGSSVIEADPPQFGGAGLGGAVLSANAGTTLATPIRTQVAGLGVASNGVANVSVRISNEQSSPTLTCANQVGYADPGSVLSDSSGNTACYPAFNGSGTGTFYMLIGGVAGNAVCANGTAPCYMQEIGPFTFTSIPGPPASVQIISGNNQVGSFGQALNPLVAKLVDASGNAVQGQTMVWSVVPPGAADLTDESPVTDSNGEVTTTVSLDFLASAGVTITVALQSNSSLSAAFQETVPNALTAMNKIGGDNQTAQVGAKFANPLVVQVVNASGPVANFPVKLQVSGPVGIPGGTTVYTNANGEASVTVTAGTSAGPATVTAVAAALTQSFALTVKAAPPPPL